MFNKILIFLILLPGCASFVRTNEKPVDVLSLMDGLAKDERLTVEVNLQAGSTIKSSKEGSKHQVKLAHELQRYLENRLNRDLKFSRIEIVSTNQFIKKNDKKIWWWSSILTLGIIPFWSNSSVLFKAKVIKKGNTTYETSYEDGYLMVQQTLLIPLIFKSMYNAHEYIGKIQIDRFIRELGQKDML